MITDQTCTDPPDTDDTKGLTRLVQFDDCASAIDGPFQQALMATGAGAFDAFLDFRPSRTSLGHKGRWPDRAHLPVVQRETKAAAVAWLVCQRNGVGARSRAYLSSLIGRVDMTQVSPYAIFEAANRVESRTQPVVRA